MYCKRCGKYIESGDLCAECVSEEIVFGKEVVVKQYKEKDPSRKAGLKRGVIGACLGVFAVIFAVIGFVLATLVGVFNTMTSEIVFGKEMAIPVVILVALAIVTTVLGGVFGVRSVAFAFRDRKANGVLPIATLVLGYVAIGCALAAAIFVFYTAAGSLALLIWRP